MTSKDAKKFGEIMAGVAENFGVQLSTAGMDMRFRALASFPIEAVEGAALSLLASRKYTTMPTVAEFLEHINGGSSEDVAEVEAAKVLKAVRMVGGYRSVVFDDPVTMAVIVHGFGGWQKLCTEMTEDQTKWFQKDFVRIYGAYSRRNTREFGYLPGRSELHNTANGLQSKEVPLLIGDRKQALLVLNTVQAQDTGFGISPALDFVVSAITGPNDVTGTGRQ